MSVCICTTGIAASGTLAGTGSSPITVLTVPSDGFYLFAGSNLSNTSMFVIGGNTINFASSSTGGHLPAQYMYLTTGSIVQVQTDTTGSWTAVYAIYSM